MGNTKDGVMSIKNGWLHNTCSGINKVMDVVNEMISNKKVEGSVKIFHADAVKLYYESTTNKLIEISIIGNTVCPTVNIRLNINYHELTESEYFELLETVIKDKKLKKEKYG